MVDNNTGFSESFILGLIASMGGLISLVFGAMRKSRCSNISCCGGLFKCVRDPLTAEEMALEPATPVSHPPTVNTV